MKHTYKFIFLALIATASHMASAEMEFADTSYTNFETVAEPRLQLKLFPGIARAPKKSAAMHMVEPQSNQPSFLSLNNSLDKPNQAYQTEKYLDDIEVTSNNLLEIRF